MENLETSLCMGGPACERAAWRAWKQVTQCHHLTQHLQGMLLLSKLDISPGAGITTTFPPLPFLGQIWCRAVSQLPNSPWAAWAVRAKRLLWPGSALWTSGDHSPADSTALQIFIKVPPFLGHTGNQTHSGPSPAAALSAGSCQPR